ncbi:MAG: hypothetical protein RL392_1137, partial [Pseudomonadota bacterium]
MTAYTIGNLQNDSVSLAKNFKDALTSDNESTRGEAWQSAAVNATKVVADLAYLAANDPKWAAILGNAATLEALRVSVLQLNAEWTNASSIADVKAGTVLGVIGGISDVGGALFKAPGPILVAGLVLRGIGLAAGIAQNVVGEQTIGQVLGAEGTNPAPLVPASLFPALPSPIALAPDGQTPLMEPQITVVGDIETKAIWTKDISGNYFKSETVVQKDSNGNTVSTNLTQYKYNSDGVPVSGETYRFDGSNAIVFSQKLIPTADGQSWSNAGPTTPITLSEPTPARDSNALVTINADHTITLKGGYLSDAFVVQKNLPNSFTDSKEFYAAVMVSNPSLTNINQVSVSQVIQIPQKMPDGSITYHYAGGTSLNTNPNASEFHLTTADGSGLVTQIDRAYAADGVNGPGYYTQNSEYFHGQLTQQTVAFQRALDSDV